MLGNILSNGIYVKNIIIIIAIDYFIQSSSNGHNYSRFVVGYFYHEGKHVEWDIKKTIYYYKEASTFNNQYAKK